MLEDVKKVRVIQDGVEVELPIGVSEPIKAELDKKANKEETITNINIVVNDGAYALYYNAFIEICKNHDSSKPYLVNNQYYTFIQHTFNGNHIMYMFDLKNITLITFDKTGYGCHPDTCTVEDFNSPIIKNFQPQLTAGEGINISEDNIISASGGLYTNYLKFTIYGSDDIPRRYTISIDTFKPINTVEEFKDYIRNRLIYSDTPTYSVAFIHFMLLTSAYPIYLAFNCAYYGEPTCQVQEINPTDNNIISIVEGTNIIDVLGRIQDFEVLTTIKS